ncbi:MAG: Crp/Fnr family transcriptional regulator [Chloroflexi bacterium]|nr:Crp/Fnr family transcriptional regulator [Chloroflexota bacterium]
MISPELLKKYAFFGSLNHDQLRELAMIAEEEFYDAGTDILQVDAPADGLYLLTSGHVDLFAVSQDKHDPSLRKEFLVGEVSPGEPFGISALSEPYKAIAQVRADTACTAIKIEANALRALIEKDHHLGYALTRQIARYALERLAYTQAQLAAARA